MGGWTGPGHQLLRHLATTHASTYHQLTVAKQSATIDIISGGRFGLYVVAGWNNPEIEMFGASLREREERYRYLTEWMEIVLRLWIEDEEFDYQSDFFNIVRGGSRPQPLQKPHPPIMNAASSGTGLAFAARVADICLVQLSANDPEA
jgi:FMNH2-dependent dimethyl sulfone monooxygenase